MLTDDQIAAMSPVERRGLIERLLRPGPGVLPSTRAIRRSRSVRLLVIVGGAVILVPWTVHLATSLPRRTVVDHWPAVWVGFDVFLLLMLAGTAWLGWKRRQAVVLTAFATGTLILADAWFDVATSNRADVGTSLAMAITVEIPVAVLLVSSALRLLRLSAVATSGLPASIRWWQVPGPAGPPTDVSSPPEPTDRRARRRRVCSDAH